LRQEDEEPTLQEFSYTNEDLEKDTLSVNAPVKPHSVSFTEKAFEDESGKRVTYQELYMEESDFRRDTREDMSRRGTVGDEDYGGRRGTVDDRFRFEDKSRTTSLNSTLTKTADGRFRFDDKGHTTSLSSTLTRGNTRSLNTTLDRKKSIGSETHSQASLTDSLDPELSESPAVQEESTTCKSCESCRLFFSNGLLWSTTLHLLVNALVAGFVAIVLRFDVAGGGDHPDHNANKNNFCSGKFTSLLELQALSDCVRLMGSFLYPTQSLSDINILSRLLVYFSFTL
jgi:hypothetical protein